MFENAFRSLAISSSFVVEALELMKAKNKVEVVDFGKIQHIRTYGLVSQVLRGALTPALVMGRRNSIKYAHPFFLANGCWKFHYSFGMGTTFAMSRGLPSSMVIGLKVHDPRLR